MLTERGVYVPHWYGNLCSSPIAGGVIGLDGWDDGRTAVWLEGAAYEAIPMRPRLEGGSTSVLDWSSEPADARRPKPRLGLETLATVGARAGLAGGVAMIAVQMLNGEIAAEATAVPGTLSSTWTAITSISAFLLGVDAFSASFAFLSITLGLTVHLLMAMALGVIGVAFALWTLGSRPGPLAAALTGLAYGLFLQVLVLNLTVNSIDDPNILYQSTPSWSWWLAHGVYGFTLGLAAARLLARRTAPS